MIYNKANLQIARLASKKDNQYGHNVGKVVHLQKDRSTFTDGYLLIQVETPPQISVDDIPRKNGLQPAEDFSEANLPAEKAIEVAKFLGKLKSNLPILHCAWIGSETKGKAVQIIATDLETWMAPTVTPETQTYPDTKKLAPKTPPLASVNLNVKLLKDLVATLDTIGVQHVQINVREELEPVELLGTIYGEHHKQKTWSLIMPCNVRK